MGRTKVAACVEAAPDGDWDALNDTDRTDMVRMYSEALRGTLQGMESAGKGRPFGNLTGPEIAELARIRNSMRATYERILGVGVTVVGASSMTLDE